MSSTAPFGTEPAPRRRNRALFLKWAAAAGMGLAVIGASVGIGQSTAARPSDDVLQLRVQSALDNDPTLKPHKLTLLVNVVDRVAVIGGPVPEEALRGKVEAVAKGVAGIAEVKVTVWVPASLTPADPLSKKVAELMTPEPPLSKKAEPPPPPVPVLSLPPAEPPKKVDPPKAEARNIESPRADPRPVAQVTSRKTPDGVLLEPVAPTGTGFRPAPLAPGAAQLPYSTIPPPGVPAFPPETTDEPKPKARPTDYSPVDPPKEVAKAPAGLDELRADRRFAGLTVELSNGVAVIAGRPAGGSEQTWALAQALRKLPGVERVLVRTK